MHVHQDSFMNLAKKGYEAYSESQENVSQTGGRQYDRPAQEQQHHNYDSGHSNSAELEVDGDYAVEHAARHGSGDSSLFSSAMDFLKSNSGAKHETINEEEVTSAHNVAYQQGSGSNLSTGSLGSAAAMQAFKLFTSGQSQKSEGADTKSHLVSLAMSEASKLFDKSGGAASGGGKQEVVNSAAMTVMKLLVQSKMSSTMGGSNSGGLSGLMSLASKFA
ncbi:hypothetical protein EW145_g3444 [Phellinidium pouzarii]|uniref:DUF7721 domain-containing protein n=1 Tax=Phellinidium pouzarii TaxID=167371 RepID=A0A4S4LCF1_9AGAM|nr:hypothetical protein EW145_g3444 [Phellinidium pouzarii]